MNFSKFKVTFLKNEQEIFQEEYQNQTNKKNCIQFASFGYDTILDTEEETFTRENNEFIFFLDIKNKKCTIQMKAENMTFDIQVDECNLTKKFNKIILEYTIETEDKRNKLIIEKKGDTLYE